MPRSLPRRVRVRHTTSGAEKWVLRSQLKSLYGWERVPDRKKKRPPEPSPEAEPTPVEPAGEPDASTEEE